MFNDKLTNYLAAHDRLDIVWSKPQTHVRSNLINIFHSKSDSESAQGKTTPARKKERKNESRDRIARIGI